MAALQLIAAVAAASCVSAGRTTGYSVAGSKPNVVILFCDDWGYGDLGLNGFGAETPNMDAMVLEGVRMTDMHAMSLCTPSRAALMTGRLGLRTGVVVNFGPASYHGLPTTEHTLAELLKPAGYDTKVIGKWHLGHAPGYHPTYRGFDEYVGVPYSLDMGCVNTPDANIPADAPCPYDNSSTLLVAPAGAPAGSEPALPLYEVTGPNCSFPAQPNCNANIAQQPANLTTLTEIYASSATEWVDRHGPGGSRDGTPFLLYIPFSHVHVPLAHNPKWTGKSKRNNVFADTLLELDDAIGQVWAALKATGLDQDTLVFLTGDNGPWNIKCDLAGSQGPFTGQWQVNGPGGGGASGKFTTWEGGHHEVGAFIWPGRIPAGTVSTATASTLDIVPTVLALAGVPLPSDRTYDGFDLSPVLFQGAPKVRDYLVHPNTNNGNITAIRYLNYTAYLQTGGAPNCTGGAGKHLEHDVPLIFDIGVDPAQLSPVTPIGVAIKVEAHYRAVMANIANTFTSKTNYSSGDWHQWPCCNSSHTRCRCTN